MDQLRQDLRYAVRTLSRNPGFLLVAVLSLGLGIGANTAIFGLINAVMLRALPVAHPDRLVLLTDPDWGGVAIETTEGGERHLLSYPEFDELRAHNQALSVVFAAASLLSAVDLFPGPGPTDHPVKAQAQLVSGEFFGALGVTPAVGRAFTPAEDRVPGANPVAVISYGFWQRQFGGDRSAVGQTVRLGQAPFQIVGVAPASFRGVLLGSDPDLWVPITMQRQLLPGRNFLTPRDTLWLQVMGRLAPGMSRQQAEAGVNVEFQQILRGWAASLPNEKDRRDMLDQKIVLRDGSRGASTLRGEFSDPLVMLMSMVGLVLLIACANVANLMLARASGRQREIGVRLALGAGRRRLIRQLLTESLVVASLGGLAGLAVAAWGTDLLVAMVGASTDRPALGPIQDTSVFLFTAAVSLATGILFGLAPAFRATRVDLNRTLAAGARGSIGGRGRTRTGRILVVAQVGLSLVLLIGATLFVRSLHNLAVQRLGFDRDHLLMARVDPVAAGYKQAALPSVYRQVLERLRRVPGVRAATVSNTGLFRADSGDPVSLDIAAPHQPSEMHSAWTLVGPGYFTTAGIPLLRGREIDGADAARGAPVCVVNQSFARFFFGDSNPIGRHVTDEYPTTRTTFEIVGVAADAREHELRGKQEARFYGNLTYPIGTVDSVVFVLRASGDPAGVESAVRSALAEVDRALPVLYLRTVNEQIDRNLVTMRLIAGLSAGFGVLALLLAAIGLYGVMACAIGRRTGEIGLRVALGATRRRVVWMTLRETLALVAVGVAIGVPCAVAAGALVKSMLFGLTPADPPTIAAAIAIIVSVTLLAGYVPARRASRIDPMQALRGD